MTIATMPPQAAGELGSSWWMIASAAVATGTERMQAVDARKDRRCSYQSARNQSNGTELRRLSGRSWVLYRIAGRLR